MVVVGRVVVVVVVEVLVDPGPPVKIPIGA